MGLNCGIINIRELHSRRKIPRNANSVTLERIEDVVVSLHSGNMLQKMALQVSIYRTINQNWNVGMQRLYF